MENKLVKYDSPIIIRQHNAITCASYEMSAAEKNILCMLLAQIDNRDSGNMAYKISVKELEELTDSKLNYKQIRLSTAKLITRVYNIQEGNKRIQVSPVTVARYEKGTGTITLKFSKEIRPYFFNLKNRFTEYELQMSLKLRSKNTKHLYEIFCQWKDTGIFRISLLELKKRLMLFDTETGKEEYEKFGLFAKKVLDLAKQELAKYTNISFTYKPKKTGRKITDLEFDIVYKPIVEVSKGKGNNNTGGGKGPQDKVIEINPGMGSTSLSQSSALKGDQFTQYNLLTSELRWLHMHKNLAYVVVRNIATNVLWGHIDAIKLAVQKGEVASNAAVVNYFHGLLNLKKKQGNHTVGGDFKGEVTSRGGGSCVGMQAHVCKVMCLFLGIPYGQVDDIMSKIPLQDLAGAVDRIWQEIQRQNIVEKSSYALGFLEREYAHYFN